MLDINNLFMVSASGGYYDESWDLQYIIIGREAAMSKYNEIVANNCSYNDCYYIGIAPMVIEGNEVKADFLNPIAECEPEN